LIGIIAETAAKNGAPANDRGHIAKETKRITDIIRTELIATIHKGNATIFNEFQMRSKKSHFSATPINADLFSEPSASRQALVEGKAADDAKEANA
jgi:hypothetical protein